MMQADAGGPAAPDGGRNHPLAVRMAAIAFLNQNITIGCIFGSISVILGAVEARLGVGRELSTLAVSAVTLTTALGAPIVGGLAARWSLRRLMLAGTLMSMAAWLLLAGTTSFAVYLIAYGLLLGPAMAIAIILSPVLVTRWFAVNRGKALGMASAQVVIIFVPVVAVALLADRGLPAVFAMLAGLSALAALANLFVADHPPGTAPAAAAVSGQADAAAAADMPPLLRQPRFHALVLGFVVSASLTVAFATHLVPLARSWGLGTAQAATLVSVQSACGIAGTLLFGWLADRLGGARALFLLVLATAILFALLLVQPGYAAALPLTGAIGVMGAGAVPATSVALSQAFGREGFGRAWGLANLMNLPFAVLCVPLSAWVFSSTGSYAAAIVGGVLFAGLGVLVLATQALRRPPPLRPTS